MLERGIAVDDGLLPKAIRNDLFNEYRGRWLDQGELFLGYVVTASGMHLTFEVSRKDLLIEWLGQVLASFEARRQLLHLEPFTRAEMKEAIGVRMEHHQAHLREPGQVCLDGSDIDVSRSMTGCSVTVTLPSKLVEKRDMASLLVVLDSLASGYAQLTENWMKLRVRFQGWEADPRHLHEIPAIRAYLAGIMRLAPWWAGLVHPSDYVTWFGCLVAPKQLKTKRATPRFQFKTELLRPHSAMAVLRAVHLLDSTEIASVEREDLVFDLRFAIDRLERGLDVA